MWSGMTPPLPKLRFWRAMIDIAGNYVDCRCYPNNGRTKMPHWSATDETVSADPTGTGGANAPTDPVLAAEPPPLARVERVAEILERFFLAARRAVALRHRGFDEIVQPGGAPTAGPGDVTARFLSASPDVGSLVKNTVASEARLSAKWSRKGKKVL